MTAVQVYGFEPLTETEMRDYFIGYKRFVCYFHFLGWDHIQLGFHVHLSSPNIEVHVPFGFFRVGMLQRIAHRGKPRDNSKWAIKRSVRPYVTIGLGANL